MLLSDKQKKYYEAINWLIDPEYLGEGRTTLLAYAFVNLAMQKRGRSVQIFDHVPLQRAHDNLLYIIENIIKMEYPQLLPYLELNRQYIRIEALEPNYKTKDSRYKVTYTLDKGGRK